MIRKKRPASGPLALLLIAASLALSTLACTQKQGATEDSWRLSPPTLETSDLAGEGIKKQTLSKLNIDAAANDTSILRFAEVDQGLSLKVRSLCESGSEKTAEFASSISIQPTVSLLMVIPPTVFRPESLKKDWICKLQIRASNKVGSVHSFAIENLKINLLAAHARYTNSTAQELTGETGIRFGFTRRLVCSSWWTDVQPGTDLATAARSEKVEGTDNRDSDRQPTCSVIHLADGPRIARFFQPQFGRASISWKLEPTVLGSQIASLMQRPLLRWHLQNHGGFPQTVFIPTASDLRISVYANLLNNTFAWGPALRVPAVITAEGADLKRTAAGLYVRIPARATVPVTLHSNRTGIACIFQSASASGVTISARQAYRFRTLSNTGQIGDLASANGDVLDRTPRDPVLAEEPAHLTELVLQASPGADAFVATETTVDQARASGADGVSLCTNGNRVDLSDLTTLRWLTE